MKTIYILWGMLVLTAMGVSIYYSLEQNRLLSESLQLMNNHLGGEISITQKNINGINTDINDLKLLTGANLNAIQNTQNIDDVQKKIESLERNILDMQSKIVVFDISIKSFRDKLDLIASDILLIRQQTYLDKLKAEDIKK
jgi:predicted  nucleic acid-binding Zn-ribbon protein